MEYIELIWVGLFLPLFPLSMVFNALFNLSSNSVARLLLLLLWPAAGIYLLDGYEKPLPDWLLIWAVATATLYGFRLLAVRDMGIWLGFLATSIWALLWIAIDAGMGNQMLYESVWAFSIPLAALVVLLTQIEDRFGAAYTDLYGGLSMTTPRLSGVLVLVVLAATATPVFPGFFIMLDMMINSTPGIVTGMLLVWLLWTWASARLLQGLIVGPVVGEKIQDIGLAVTWLYGLFIALLIIAGVIVTGARL